MISSQVFDSSALSVVNFCCDAHAGATPFTELHRCHSVSYVKRGSFGYRCGGRLFELVAGSVLVGRPGTEYVCTHEHHDGGDECLSFQLDPAWADTLGDAVWHSGALPPQPALMLLGELAQGAIDGRNLLGVDEVAQWFTQRFAEIACGRKHVAQAAPVLRRIDRGRVIESALWIEAHSSEPIALDDAARRAGLSAFHFLRLFSKVLGVTPHQYLLRSRLRHAACLLPDAQRSITQIALDVGFNDLSNFVRTFHRAAGVSPRGFRALSRGERKNFQDRLARAA